VPAPTIERAMTGLSIWRGSGDDATTSSPSSLEKPVSPPLPRRARSGQDLGRGRDESIALPRRWGW
jgi:hypothetical protein